MVRCVFPVFDFTFFPFFYLKSTFFFGMGCGNLLGALFHSDKSAEELIKRQRNHLERNRFEEVVEVSF